MSEAGEHDDLVVQGDIDETKEEKERISTRTAPSGTVAAPKKAEIQKKQNQQKTKKIQQQRP
jgi:hypothetical protein